KERALLSRRLDCNERGADAMTAACGLEIGFEGRDVRSQCPEIQRLVRGASTMPFGLPFIAFPFKACSESFSGERSPWPSFWILPPRLMNALMSAAMVAASASLMSCITTWLGPTCRAFFEVLIF